MAPFLTPKPAAPKSWSDDGMERRAWPNGTGAARTDTKDALWETQGDSMPHTHINTSQPKSPVSVWSRRGPAPLCSCASLLVEELCCVLKRGMGGWEAHRKCSNADGQRATCLHGPIKQAFREGTAAVPTHTRTPTLFRSCIRDY